MYRGLAVSWAALLVATGCGRHAAGSGFTSDPTADDGPDAGASSAPMIDASVGTLGDANTCNGLECQRAKCGGGVTTNLSGTVYDPAGKVPLYNVIVYVPNAPLEPLTTGATCDRCGAIASGAPLVTTLTDSSGHFELKDVPVGASIPLVMQVGKWRRQVTVGTTACKDNAISNPGLLRLPKNSKEGDLPQIALVQGGCDPLECLLRKIGIDDAEFTPAGGKGHVQILQGAGGNAAYPPAQNVWSDAKQLSQYDVLALACECGEHPETKPQAAVDAMHDYASAGGRIFASHYHYYWFKNGAADFSSTAQWSSTLDTWGTTYLIDTTFPKGQAFSDWLKVTGAAPAGYTIDLDDVKTDVGTVNAPTAQRWIYLDKTQSSVESDKYFSFNTPVTAKEEDKCGRVVFSDVHVSATSEDGTDPTDPPGQVFPTGCHTTGLSAQEKALEFLFFDLSACVQNDAEPPTPPK